MKRFPWLLIIIAFCVSTFLVPENSGAQDTQGKFRRLKEGAIQNRYIVVFKQNVQRRDVDWIADDLTRMNGTRYRHTYKNALKGFSVELSETAAFALSQDPRVEFVEEDGIASIVQTQPNAPWGLDRIDQRNRPLNGTYLYGNTGTGVRVYVLDTGIRITHQQFGGRAFEGTDIIGGRACLSPPGGGGPPCPNGAKACDPRVFGGDPHGHGTHVAGTIGGTTYGVAKNVTLYSVRVLDSCGTGTYAEIISGIDWVTTNAVRPAVANMSLGGPASDALDSAVRGSIASGITYTLAAGNSSTSSSCVDAGTVSPARVGEALTVSATDQTDKRASFANGGSVVDLFAPGFDIPSSCNTSDTAVCNKSGTSMAAPHVAGVAALYLQSNTSASPAQVSSAITSNATAGVVTNSCLGAPNRLLYSQFNVAKFISQSVPNCMIPGQTSNVSLTMRNIGSTTWTSASSYKLGSQNPENNSTWGISRVELPASVPPNYDVTFNFNIRAPSAAGTYNFQWRMLQEMVEWFGDVSPNIPITVNGGLTPFLGIPVNVPGIVQAENFDKGCEGVAYHDVDTINHGGQYRSTGVDITATADTGGGYIVGWTNAGEWLKYTVNVSTAGIYTLEARVASAISGGSFHVEFNGINATGTMVVPNTGGWDTWTTIRKKINLSAGQQIMRVAMDTGGFNLNYIRLAQYQGNLDAADCQYIAGWAWDRGQPNTPINVDILSDGSPLSTIPASAFRQDLLNAGIGNGYHAFAFPVPANLKNGQPHSIAVKFSGTSDQLTGSPKTITCSGASISIQWIKPAEKSWGPPGSLTAAGYALNGSGTVQLVWRDATINGNWNVVGYQATPGPGGDWSNSIPAPTNKCHIYQAYANYNGVSSSVFTYNGVTAGDCTETARVIWIQPQPLAGFGPPGSLVVAGEARNAPAGYTVQMLWRNLTINGPWNTEPYQPVPDANGIWYHSIPNANYFQQYAVYVRYDVITSATCTYAGNNNIKWCP